MDISSIKPTGLTSAPLQYCAAEAAEDSEWNEAFSAAMDGEPEVGAPDSEPEAAAPADESDETVTQAETEVSASTAEASVQDVQVMEVQYLDGATNTTKTGYVINGLAYEDPEGTTPVSDYSQFRTSNGLLHVKTPYGTIQATEYSQLLEYQSSYDTQTFGEAIHGINGVITGTASFNDSDVTVTAPRSSYTSAPNGPGSISQEIFDQYYGSVAGTTSTITVGQLLEESTSEESGTTSSEATAATSDASDSDEAETVTSQTSSTAGLVDSTTLVQMVKSMISVSGESFAENIMEDIASLSETMNASRSYKMFSDLS